MAATPTVLDENFLQNLQAYDRNLHHDGFCQNVKTVLLVGETGAGKSSFANYLYNYNAQPPGNRPGLDNAECAKWGLRTGHLFESNPVDTLGEPHTQNTSFGLFEFDPSGEFDVPEEAFRVQLIDTPGLGEVDRTKDFFHMWEMICQLRALRQVHMVVLCLRYGRNIEAAMRENLTYYRQLLSPLFDARRLVIAITGYSNEDFKRNLEQKHPKTDRQIADETVLRGGLGAILKLDDHHRPLLVRRVESLPAPSSLRKLMECRRGLRPLRANIHWMTHDFRVNLLLRLQALDAIDFSDHRFSLPPFLLQELAHTRLRLDHDIARLGEQLQLQQVHQDFYSGRVGELTADIERYEANIRRCEHRLEPLDGTLTKTIGPLCGTGILHLFDPPELGDTGKVKTFTCPGLPQHPTSFEVKLAHNCRFVWDPNVSISGTNVHPSPDGRSSQVTGRLIVDYIALRALEGGWTWSFIAEFTYSGKDIHGQEIERLQETIAEQQLLLDGARQRYDVLKAHRQTIDAETQKLLDRMQQLGETRRKIDHPDFTFDELTSLVQHLQQIYRSI